MTIYNKISQNSSYLASFQQLYLENFPDCERRDWGEVLGIMERDERFHVMTASDDSIVTGFVSYWLFGRFAYIEHLAVEASRRRGGTGSELVRQVMALGLPVILEVEPPIDPVTRRRVAFYECLGLELHDEIDYVQPPYAPGKPSVPMCLMTSSEMLAGDIDIAVEVLKREVYGVKPEDNQKKIVPLQS